MSHPIEQFTGDRPEGYVAPPVEGRRPIESAVVWYGPWHILADGMGNLSRFYLESLTSAGVAVRINGAFGMFEDQLAGISPHIRALRTTDHKRTSLVVQHFVCTEANVERAVFGLSPRDRSLLGPAQARTILATILERDRVSQSIAEKMNLCGQVWVTCNWNRDALVQSGVDPEKVKVVCCPAPLALARPWLLETKFESFSNEPSISNPMFFYNIGKWEPRKNQHGLIGAFLRTFRPDEGANLMIKTSAFGQFAGYPRGPQESLAYWFARDARVMANGWTEGAAKKYIKLVSEKLSDDGLRRWHEGGHVYVSASHGEGWDYPAFEARSSGARLIVPPLGGYTHYMVEGVDVPLKMLDPVPCHAGYGWGTCKWGNPDIQDLEQQMRTVFDDEWPEAQKTLPTVKAVVKSKSIEAIGKEMRGHMLDLLRKNGDKEEL